MVSPSVDDPQHDGRGGAEEDVAPAETVALVSAWSPAPPVLPARRLLRIADAADRALRVAARVTGHDAAFARAPSQ
jgi:hypothetical protein